MQQEGAVLYPQSGNIASSFNPPGPRKRLIAYEVGLTPTHALPGYWQAHIITFKCERGNAPVAVPVFKAKGGSK